MDALLRVVLQVLGHHILDESLLHKHLGALGRRVGVWHHLPLQLTEFLQLVGVDHRHRLQRLVGLGLLVQILHLLLHLVLEVSRLLRLVHDHHLLVKVILVLLKCRVVGHHHPLVLLAPAVQRLHMLLLLLLSSRDEVRVRLSAQLLLLRVFLPEHIAPLLLLGSP
jgi:hypothetical protein